MIFPEDDPVTPPLNTSILQKSISKKPPRGKNRWWLNGRFLFSGTIILFFLIIALFSHVLAPHDPLKMYSGHLLETASANFWMGTDELGRDLLSRLMYGARTSLLISFSSVAIAVFAGTTLGLVAAYFGGAVDMVIMRLMDVILSFPMLILAIAAVAFLGSSIPILIVVIGILYIPGTARLVHNTTLSIKEYDYVTAARTIGAKNSRIILQHILPNVMAPLLIQIALMLGFVLVTESGLSYLGLGPQPPNPSWGQMIATGRRYIDRQPWLLFSPMLILSIVILAYNLMGDALRDILDPKLKKR
jgi:ABC-type dipeptide/oligopeptide/nickel transport system permease subunit